MISGKARVPAMLTIGHLEVTKKGSVLREPQHERNIISDFNSSTFVPWINSGLALGYVERLREGFSAAR
jgi:hypothetical protein